MNRFTRLQILLLNTLAVAISIVVAYGLQQILVMQFNLAAARATFAFGLALPVILVSLQVVISKFFKSETQSFTQVIYKPKLNPQTIQSIHTFKDSLAKTLQQQFQINQFILYVFDWKRNTYFECCPKGSEVTHVLPAQHALVKFGIEYHTVYCTDRHIPEEDYLSDAALAEITTFMRRHKYVFAIPLLTVSDVYGFVFLTLSQVKDTPIYAAPTFDEFTALGKSFGGLLQKILIYDAIVLKHNL